PPKIIGGYDALLEHLVYPEELKKAGVEGTVIVQIHVQKDGSVDKTHLLKSSGYEQLDKAALDAAMKIDFEHVGEPADVWIALPVIFKLDNQ
ncbi:MAG: energy transducer TonB, partial [Candidatus Marinimicrobia bacterium]|nr:energy transducer TonB [Candidatus Neomarinimicrobiota bacterium]